MDGPLFHKETNPINNMFRYRAKANKSFFILICYLPHFFHCFLSLEHKRGEVTLCTATRTSRCDNNYSHWCGIPVNIYTFPREGFRFESLNPPPRNSSSCIKISLKNFAYWDPPPHRISNDLTWTFSGTPYFKLKINYHETIFTNPSHIVTRFENITKN